MRATTQARLETRISADTKKALRVYCAHNGLTIREGVEIAVLNLCGIQEQKKEVEEKAQT